MNLLLVDPKNVRTLPDQRRVTVIDDERVRHIRRILKAQPGDRLIAGVLGGPIGNALITEMSASEIHLTLELDQEPPPPLETDLLLALPRPKFLGRILQTVASVGVKRILLINTARVQKSYWESSLLAPTALNRHLRLGLEQARDSILPELELVRSFDELVKDILPPLVDDRPLLVAHAESNQPFPRAPIGPCGLLIGPEGGLLDDELEALTTYGGKLVTLSPRPLRVETAVSVALSRLLPDHHEATSA